jgi:hypothetical protein
MLKAADLTVINTMATSIKEVDRAVKALADASLTLKKFEAALVVKGISKKVADATGVSLMDLIGSIDKVGDRARAYSVKVSTIKEMV